MLVELSWLAIALIVHSAPAMLFFRPGLTEKLYGVAAEDTTGLLLIHRGALFLGIVVVSLFAAFHADGRPAASIVVTISMIGFLLVYLKAGLPSGPLRKIAIVDFIGLIPLAIVLWDVWGQGILR